LLGSGVVAWSCDQAGDERAEQDFAASAHIVHELAWFEKCHFQVTPEIDRALMVKRFLVLGVTLI